MGDMGEIGDMDEIGEILLCSLVGLFYNYSPAVHFCCMRPIKTKH